MRPRAELLSEQAPSRPSEDAWRRADSPNTGKRRRRFAAADLAQQASARTRAEVSDGTKRQRSTPNLHSESFMAEVGSQFMMRVGSRNPSWLGAGSAWNLNLMPWCLDTAGGRVHPQASPVRPTGPAASDSIQSSVWPSHHASRELRPARTRSFAPVPHQGASGHLHR